jgi:hypothetical protein
MRKVSEAERVRRGSLAIVGIVAALACSFAPWWSVAAGMGVLLLWNLGWYVFMKPEPRRAVGDGEGPYRARRTER